MKILKNTVLVLSLLLVSPLSAQAAYFLASFGNSDLQEDEFEEDTAIKIGIGFESSESLKFEVSSLNLGKFEIKEAGLAELSNIIGATFTDSSLEITGIDLSVLGIMPLNDTVSLQGRVGVYLWDAELKATVSGFGEINTSEDGNDTGFGVGALVALSENVGLTFMYDQYKAFEGDIDLLNAGIKISY
jgi:hypothetical protein